MTEHCVSCRFFDKVATGDDSGTCHRYAPKPTIVKIDGCRLEATWPIVYPTSWCGEHVGRPR